MEAMTGPRESQGSSLWFDGEYEDGRETIAKVIQRIEQFSRQLRKGTILDCPADVRAIASFMRITKEVEEYLKCECTRILVEYSQSNRAKIESPREEPPKPSNIIEVAGSAKNDGFCASRTPPGGASEQSVSESEQSLSTRERSVRKELASSARTTPKSQRQRSVYKTYTPARSYPSQQPRRPQSPKRAASVDIQRYAANRGDDQSRSFHSNDEIERSSHRDRYRHHKSEGHHGDQHHRRNVAQDKPSRDRSSDSDRTVARSRRKWQNKFSTRDRKLPREQWSREGYNLRHQRSETREDKHERAREYEGDRDKQYRWRGATNLYKQDTPMRHPHNRRSRGGRKRKRHSRSHSRDHDFKHRARRQRTEPRDGHRSDRRRGVSDCSSYYSDGSRGSDYHSDSSGRSSYRSRGRSPRSRKSSSADYRSGRFENSHRRGSTKSSDREVRSDGYTSRER